MENPKRKSQNNLKIVERKCYSAELIHKLSNITLRSQTLSNNSDIFQNIYHVDLHFRKWRGEFFLHTLHLHCFSAEAYLEPFQTSKMECFCVIS